MTDTPRNVRFFGDHHDYEGDQPWWTIRFAADLSKADQKKVAQMLNQSPAASDGCFEPTRWEGPHQCVWETCDPWFETPKAWAKFYKQVDASFQKVCSDYPVFAILLQEGQFHNGESLVGLSNAELETIE